MELRWEAACIGAFVSVSYIGGGTAARIQITKDIYTSSKDAV
jgi:hypothetical protein